VTIGFDNVFDHFEKMFENEWSIPTYPPYNIVKTGDQKFDIELALAGVTRKNIAVEYADGQLNIKSVKDEKSDNGDDAIYKGIAKRYFSKTFTIADDVEVKKAELKDGLLKISLERILPEGRKARTIEIK
jgi:molecular chaperone IbpA